MYWVCQNSRPPAPKGNSKLEILLVKIFNLKQKTSRTLPATIEKINFVFSKKRSMAPLNNGLQWGNIKQNPFKQIYACSRIFRHIQIKSGIFRNYSGIFRTLCNPGIFKTMVYSET